MASVVESFIAHVKALFEERTPSYRSSLPFRWLPFADDIESTELRDTRALRVYMSDVLGWSEYNGACHAVRQLLVVELVYMLDDGAEEQRLDAYTAAASDAGDVLQTLFYPTSRQSYPEGVDTIEFTEHSPIAPVDGRQGIFMQRLTFEVVHKVST